MASISQKNYVKLRWKSLGYCEVLRSSRDGVEDLRGEN